MSRRRRIRRRGGLQVHSVAVHGHCRMRVVVRRRPAIIQPTSYQLDKILSHLFYATKFLSQKARGKNVFYIFFYKSISTSQLLSEEILNNCCNCLNNQYKRERVNNVLWVIIS